MNNDIVSKETLISIQEMNEKNQNNLILDLQESEYWPAVCRFLFSRCSMVQSVLFSEDPSQNPHAISKAQGTLSGLQDLIIHAKMLRDSKKSKKNKVTSDDE